MTAKPLLFLLALSLCALFTGCHSVQEPSQRRAANERPARMGADTVRHYDRYGNLTGSTTTRARRQYHYDKYGNLTGTSTLPAKGNH